METIKGYDVTIAPILAQSDYIDAAILAGIFLAIGMPIILMASLAYWYVGRKTKKDPEPLWLYTTVFILGALTSVVGLATFAAELMLQPLEVEDEVKERITSQIERHKGIDVHDVVPVDGNDIRDGFRAVDADGKSVSGKVIDGKVNNQYRVLIEVHK